MSGDSIQGYSIRAGEDKSHRANGWAEVRTFKHGSKIKKRQVRLDCSVDIGDHLPKLPWISGKQIMYQLFSEPDYTTEHVLDRTADADATVGSKTRSVDNHIGVKIRIGDQIFPGDVHATSHFAFSIRNKVN